MGWLDPSSRPEEVAPRLLGMRLTTRSGGATTAVVLTEVEAYGGADDPASHAHRSSTKRNASMFGTAGTLYVYRSYGIHTCANVVVGEAGIAGAVLLRAGRVVAGHEVVRARRGRDDHLTDGPGKLCQALGISLDDDGLDLFAEGSHIELAAGPPPAGIAATPRIGISRATDRRWRFVATD